jgi:flagellar hook assembly protein FlgD
VQECDATGTSCQGTKSAKVTFTVAQLMPSVSSASPNPFSPNNDGRNDKWSFRVHLPDSEQVSYVVQDSNAQTIAGPHASNGMLAAGDHTFTWDGRTNAGAVVGDGTYTVVVDTSEPNGGSPLSGTATTTVRVDRTPPVLSGPTGNQSTLYPVPDGFLDRFRPSVNVNEGGVLWLEVTKASGAHVFAVGQAHPSPGTFQLTWDGRDNSGRLLPAGNYDYSFVAQDKAGNRSESRTLVVHVSMRHVIRHTVVLSRFGNVGHPSTTNTNCTLYSLGFSNFAHGLWLDNNCDPGFEGSQWIYADYTFAVPGAVQYADIQVRAYGETLHAPEPVSAFVYDFTHGSWDPVGSVKITRKLNPALTKFGDAPGQHNVSLHHRVRIRIAVPDKVTPEDYDIAAVSIALRYDTLSPA